MKRYAPLLLLACTSGCYSNVWYVDSRFTAGETEQIQAAANTWSAAGRPVDLVFGSRVDISDTDRNVIARTTSRGVHQEFPEETEVGSSGYTSQPTIQRPHRIMILMMDKIPDGMFENVVRHELGHAAGVHAHAADRRAVMFPVSSSRTLGCLTSEDLALAEVGGHGCEE